MLDHEKDRFNELNFKYAKYWMPFQWSFALLYDARQQGKISSDILLGRLIDVSSTPVLSQIIICLLGSENVSHRSRTSMQPRLGTNSVGISPSCISRSSCLFCYLSGIATVYYAPWCTESKSCMMVNLKNFNELKTFFFIILNNLYRKSRFSQNISVRPCHPDHDHVTICILCRLDESCRSIAQSARRRRWRFWVQFFDRSKFGSIFFNRIF